MSTDPFMPPAPVAVQVPQPDRTPLYVRDTQQWAIEQERQRHDQALYSVGEYAAFFLMWNLLDFEQGLVTRCPRCSGSMSGTDAHQKVATVYEQPLNNRCPYCYGTTFAGGYRARIIRPALFGDADQDNRLDAKGQVNPEEVLVESTTDFRVRAGDFVVRADNRRYQLRTPRRVMLRSGFGHPTQTDTSINYSLSRASREAPGTVAYMLPPGDDQRVGEMLTTIRFTPAGTSTYEDIKGPLIPDGD